MQDSGPRSCSWAIRLVDTSFVCITTTFPGEASGMVFVDTALEDAGTIQGMPHREMPRIPRPVILGLSTVLSRLGMIRFLSI